MMSIVRRVMMVFVIVSVIVCNAVCVSAETQVQGEPAPEMYSLNGSNDKYLLDAEGNQYGYTQWSSFGAARRYYGVDRTYYQCDRLFGGAHYNFCYQFADGLYMFFGVK